MADGLTGREGAQMCRWIGKRTDTVDRGKWMRREADGTDAWIEGPDGQAKRQKGQKGRWI